MKRIAEEFLTEWLNKKSRKPLLIRGARQVGKSTLVRLFAENYGLDLVEINLEKQEIKSLKKSKDLKVIMAEIEIIAKKNLRNKNTLLFLDEIQACPEAISSLRYFYEEYPELPVVAAGSLLEFVLESHEFSMPVGRVEFYHLGPMSFTEFLWALGEDKLVLQLKESFYLAYELFFEKLTEYLEKYYYLGGMPGVIKNFIETNSLLEARSIQRAIVESYFYDLPKYSKGKQVVRLENVLRRLPHFIGKKLKYSELLPGENYPAIKLALEMLEKARLVMRCAHTNATNLPLEGTKDESVFKLYFLDIGLLNYLYGNDWNDLNTHLSVDGEIAEQFVAQHLAYKDGGSSSPCLYYWLRDKKANNAEVDFIIKMGSEICPLEVKAGKSGKMKSLMVFIAEHKSKKAYRLDLTARKSDSFNELITVGDKEFALLNFPLWGVEFISSDLNQT